MYILAAHSSSLCFQNVYSQITFVQSKHNYFLYSRVNASMSRRTPSKEFVRNNCSPFKELTNLHDELFFPLNPTYNILSVFFSVLLFTISIPSILSALIRQYPFHLLVTKLWFTFLTLKHEIIQKSTDVLFTSFNFTPVFYSSSP